jgi:hypothetical protein
LVLSTPSTIFIEGFARAERLRSAAFLFTLRARLMPPLPLTKERRQPLLLVKYDIFAREIGCSALLRY